MSFVRLFAVILAVFSGLCPARSQQETTPTISKKPLSADQIAIYRLFLEKYDQGGERPLHLAKQTEPLDEPTGKEDDETGALACLERLKIAPEKDAIGIVHVLDPSLAIPGRVVLVDPEQQAAAVKANDPSKTMAEGKTVEEAVNRAYSSGLLTLSEVAFDKKHHVAAMSFSFWCGRLCGHGGIVVFKKTGEHWKMTNKVCAEWVS